MHISNRFLIICSIQTVIRMLYHSFETLLLLRFFYLMVKSGKSFIKIGSRFQIALLLLFDRIFHPTPAILTPHAHTYLILPNVPAPSLLLLELPVFIRDPRVPVNLTFKMTEKKCEKSVRDKENVRNVTDEKKTAI